MSKHHIEKQKKVQEIYRKKRRGLRSNTKGDMRWTVILILCLLPVLLLLVTSALFDLGFELPGIFGR